MNLEERNRNYYTSVERYDWVLDAKYPEKLYHSLRARAITETVNKIAAGTRVLDVGCGTGLITRGINCKHIVATDINMWAIERARKNINGKHNVTFMYGDAEDLPFFENEFDIVICTEVLEHLLKINAAINGIYKVLKPNGTFIGSVPSRNIIWKWRTKITRTHPANEPFHNNFSIKEFRHLLTTAGFQIKKIRYIALGLGVMFIAQKQEII